MLDEKALRKPGFSEGYRVTLADGQEWTLPKPKIRFKPKVVDGKVEVGGGPSFGPEFDQQLDILFGVVDVEPIERLRDQVRDGRSTPECELRSEAGRLQ